MKLFYKVSFLLFVALILSGCYKDHSSLGERPITTLGISFANLKDSIIETEKNDTLKLDPVITENGVSKPLSYEWQVDYEVFSTEKQLVYPCTKLGSYYVRLKVTNADGSAFYHFRLNVNSAYEQGIMVLGHDNSGALKLSFLRDGGTGTAASDRFLNGVFTLNNPGQQIGRGAGDIVKRMQQILISSSEAGKIYFLNDKTFEVEATVSAPDFPDFKPIKMNVPDGGYRTAAILCEGGKIYNLALLEHLVLASNRYPVGVVDKTDFGFDYNDAYSYFWDSTTSKLLQVSAYYATSSGDLFKGQKLVTFFYSASSAYVVTRSATNPLVYTKTVLSYYLIDFSSQMPSIQQQEVLRVSGSPELSPQSVTLVNSGYRKLLYGQDNKVYQWFYSGTDFSDRPFITVPTGKVTALEQTKDGTKLIVGTAGSGSNGLNGSIYVYDMDNGKLLYSYENQVDAPVKIFYKPKNN